MTTVTFKSAAVAVGVLTSDNTNVTEGKTVTIGTKVYNFQGTVGTTEGNVHIGGDADASLLNLIRAINHTGTPNTDYYCAAANADVTADAAVTSHAITVRAIESNSLATETTDDHLAWNTTTAVTTALGDMVIVGTVADATATMPAQQQTVGYRSTVNPGHSRNIRASNNTVTVVRNGSYSVGFTAELLANAAVALEPSLTWSPPIITTAPTAATVVADGSHGHFTVVGGSELTMTYAWYESADGTTYSAISNGAGSGMTYANATTASLQVTPTLCKLTSSNAADVTNGKVVVLGAKTYTFKTTLSATFTEGEVLIGGTADASLLNLIRAINHTGTPNVGTTSVSPADAQYSCAAANAQFTADAAVASHAIRVVAIAAGTYTTTTDETTLLWTGASYVCKTGYYYRCTITDNYTTPGAVNTVGVTLTIT